MTQGTLIVEKREGKGKNITKKIRQSGLVPAIVYGEKNKDPLSIKFDPRHLEKIIRSEFGKNTIINLKVDQDEKEIKVITKQISRNPIKRNIEHVDFFILNKDNPIDVNVHIDLIGNAPGVKAGGVFIIKSRVIRIQTKYEDIPKGIDVDISELNIGDDIKFKDIHIDSKYKVKSHPGNVIVRIEPPRVMIEEEEEEEEVEVEEGEEGVTTEEGSKEKDAKKEESSAEVKTDKSK